MVHSGDGVADNNKRGGFLIELFITFFSFFDTFYGSGRLLIPLLLHTVWDLSRLLVAGYVPMESTDSRSCDNALDYDSTCIDIGALFVIHFVS